ncbi:hypothetical protein MACH17_26970 [Phaeobacter inhibens]|nr:hypothetical protein MACH17_26970 [Phaeobacter inhibens]
MAFFRRRALLAAANQGGGGFTWAMTAGSASGADGYYSLSGQGSISNEPVPGLSLLFQRDNNSNGSTRLAYSEDQRSTLNTYGFTELVVDGAVFSFTTWVFDYNRTYPNLSSEPQYINGQTYVCELR